MKDIHHNAISLRIHTHGYKQLTQQNMYSYYKYCKNKIRKLRGRAGIKYGKRHQLKPEFGFDKNSIMILFLTAEKYWS